MTVTDLDEYGEPVRDEYRRLGASGATETGLYVRFEPGFGLNVYIGWRKALYDGPHGSRPSRYVDGDELAMSGEGWERLCALVDEWRARNAQAWEESC